MKASIFMPCIIDQLYPETGKNLCSLLKRFGVDYQFDPSVTCCGQMLYKTGYRRRTGELAKKLIIAFKDSEYVVCPSSSCVNMIRNHYREILKEESKWYVLAEELSTKIYEFTEFLVYIIGVQDVGGILKARAVLHESCQLRYKDGRISPSRLILENIKGLEIVDIPGADKCCGFGGIFSFMFPEISHAMVKEKAHEIIDKGADMVVGPEMSCLMNIGGYLNRKGHSIQCLHIVDMLCMAISKED